MAAGQPNRHWPTGWQASLWNRDSTPCFSPSKTLRVSEGELELMLWRHKPVTKLGFYLLCSQNDFFHPRFITLPETTSISFTRSYWIYSAESRWNLEKLKLDDSRKHSGLKFCEDVKEYTDQKGWLKWTPKWPVAVDGRNGWFGWSWSSRCDSRPCNF